MKKLSTLLALVMAAGYAAAAADKPVVKPIPFEGKPAVSLQVFDMSGKVARPIQGNTLSISKKQNRLCWVSVNIPLQGKVNIVEAFYAPAALTLVSPGSQFDSSADNKNHTIVTLVESNNNQSVSRCWSFDQTDPIGKYKLEVQIKDQVFKGLEFEITK
ncbi:hypothetical protein M3704_06460 [Mannheimia haemolytica]|nr:hypothetical protein M3704_06460 [Mannheimia haemolytica]STY62873.1 Uncharacterised protein [Mannheimia haemolytica]